jgi:hypothetical protein
MKPIGGFTFRAMTEQLNIRRSVMAAIFALVVLIGIGGLLINVYIENERQRPVAVGDAPRPVADSKVDALARNWPPISVSCAAGKPSLQLYLWQLVRAPATGAGGVQAESAQQAYLRNLMLAAAERSGYADPQPVCR